MNSKIDRHPIEDAPFPVPDEDREQLISTIRRDFNEAHSYFGTNHDSGEPHIRGMLSHVDNVRYVYEMTQFSSGQAKTPPLWFLEKNGFILRIKLV